jgi:TP53 regulating kinase-like protein
VKHRVPKKYRISLIDERLRRSRTVLEAKLLSDAKRAGVPTPAVLEADLYKTKLVMEFIEGPQLKSLLGRLKSSERKRICREIGRLAARLHKVGIVHGDLTTSNMILGRGSKIYLVDFGLGEYNPSTEARAVDLHLLRRAIQSVHFRIASEAYREVLRGYEQEFGAGAGEVVRRAEEIAKRGRYVQREERAWR